MTVPLRWLAGLPTVACILLAGCGDAPQAPDPQRILAQGIEELGRYEFARAHQRFSRICAMETVDDRLRRQAALALAVTCHQWQPASADRIAEAKGLYQRLSEAGAGDEAVQAQLQLGRLAELSDFYGDREDLTGARTAYRQVMERWPLRPEAGEACLRLAAAWAQTLKQEDVLTGIAVLEDWLAAHPDEPKAAIMLQYLSELHWTFLGDARKAVDALLRADRRGFDGENREWMFCWRLARLGEEELHDRDLAVRYFRRIVTDYPKCGSAWEAQQELRRLGVEPPPIRLFTVKPAATASTTRGRP